MQDLYYPPRPKSKLEEYQLKLKERELYTNNILDRFTQNGNGAPIRDEKGNLIIKRKAILENVKYNDISLSQEFQNQNQNENNIIQYQSPQNANGMEDNNINNDNDNENNKFENTLNQNQIIINDDNNINDNNKINNIGDNEQYNPYSLINNSPKQINNESKEDSLNNNIISNKSNINRNNINSYSYEGIGIIPYVSDFKKIEQKMNLGSLKDDLKMAIEYKRQKQEKEKQKQKELDLKEDLKVKKAIEEENILLKLEKKKKEEEENRLRLINLQNIEKNKKKKNLIDIDEYYGKDFKTYRYNNKNINNKNDNKAQEQNEDNDDNNNNYSNINDIEMNNNINILEDISQTKKDTLNIMNDFAINIHKNRYILDNDIKNLKKEVRNQYMEMNDIFKELKGNLAEADFNKNSLLQKSHILKTNLLKNSISYTLNKNIINRNYDENMNINAEELTKENYNDYSNNNNIISQNFNLPGTSDFIYINEDENNMSSLAQIGKNIIENNTENEKIPVNDNINYNNKEKSDEEKFIMELKKECKMDDLYKELEEIENINRNMNKMNKIETLKSNFSVEYGRLLNKEKKIKERNKNKA